MAGVKNRNKIVNVIMSELQEWPGIKIDELIKIEPKLVSLQNCEKEEFLRFQELYMANYPRF